MAFEDTIRDELRDMILFFENESSLGPINPQMQLIRSVGNVICALVFGKRMGGVDAEFDRAADIIRNDLIGRQHILVVIFVK